MANGTPPSLASKVMHDVPPPSVERYDTRGTCKLRRQQPIKRESSRRIVVRPVVQRRREPSISSSCESLDELRSPIRPILNEQVICLFCFLNTCSKSQLKISSYF